MLTERILEIKKALANLTDDISDIIWDASDLEKQGVEVDWTDLKFLEEVMNLINANN